MKQYEAPEMTVVRLMNADIVTEDGMCVSDSIGMAPGDGKGNCEVDPGQGGDFGGGSGDGGSSDF